MITTKRNIKPALLGAAWIVLVPLLAWLAASDIKAGAMMAIGIVGAAMCLTCLVNYRLGYYIYITVTLCIRLGERMSGAEQQVGLVMDALLWCVLFGCIFQRGHESASKVNYAKDPLLITLYLYTLVQIIEVVNPAGPGFLVWVIFMRVFIRNLIMIYIGLNIFNSMKDVRYFFKFWLVISTLAAIYACVQQWFGLPSYELAFIARYPEKFRTVIILSGTRVYSFMSDPAVFGILMAGNIAICVILLTASKRAISIPKKLLILISAGLQMMALGYSGTRTGYVMLPLGLLIFFIANLQKRNTIIIAMVCGFTGLVILYGPFHSSPTIVRVRTAFVGKQDESVNVREVNRHRIQPYIYSHPIGGGLNTTGGNGATFAPGHPLADFQTDNGYLRAVLETGWLGLLVCGAYFFFIIQAAIINFFKVKDELDKLLMISIAAVVFSIAIAQYAQDAISLVESALLLNVFIAIVIKVRYTYDAS